MKIFLKDDHDQALLVWRKAGVKDLDLVHVDAHIDFAVHQAMRPIDALNQAMSSEELKLNLEKTLCFLKYADNLDKQTDIGNYIYPAMIEGIVRDFWWVIPGSKESLAKNKKLLTRAFCSAFNRKTISLTECEQGFLYNALGRNFYICALSTLPTFNQPILLDIDVDFMVVKNATCADSTYAIGKRKIEITPRRLAVALKSKIKNPLITTIVYSTHGGFTPMHLRCLGDELAFHFAPQDFTEKYSRAVKAASCFRQFQVNADKKAYWASIKLEPAYQQGDNNYGPLYLTVGKLRDAQRELQKILKVDPDNYFAVGNMGLLSLRQKKYSQAIVYLESALKKPQIKTASILANALGEAKIKVGLIAQAKHWFKYCIDDDRFNSNALFNLGEISFKENNHKNALRYYQSARQLGFNKMVLASRIRQCNQCLAGRQKTVIIK
jgi:tetratricopeptide (TPR) repeat protein